MPLPAPVGCPQSLACRRVTPGLGLHSLMDFCVCIFSSCKSPVTWGLGATLTQYNLIFANYIQEGPIPK